MKVAVVHYHLRPSGVTRIIERSFQALQLEKSDFEGVVLSGTPPEDGSSLPFRVVPELGYTPETGPKLSVNEFVQAVEGAIPFRPDIWHIHNHGLGKHAWFPTWVERLARRGERLLLHLHDFAEDNRPANYRYRSYFAPPERVFPVGPAIHYAVLNRRDYRILRQAGIPETWIHHLPNPVQAPPEKTVKEEPQNEEPALILYPVRGVRRKNLGELVLLAALAKAQGLRSFRFASTLGPSNPNYRPAYQRWETVIRKFRLPVDLGLAERKSIPFEASVGAARSLISTSVAEGFGLAFLEPFLFHKPLIGRDLPDITADFKEEGLPLQHLYPSLLIPRRILPKKVLSETFIKALELALRHYDMPQALPELTHRLLQSISQPGIDFGRLNEPLQEQVLEEIDSSGAHWAPTANDLLNSRLSPQSIASARDLALDRYGLAGYGRKLSNIYQGLLEENTDGGPEWIDARHLVMNFLHPENLSLLRMDP